MGTKRNSILSKGPLLSLSVLFISILLWTFAVAAFSPSVTKLNPASESIFKIADMVLLSAAVQDGEGVSAVIARVILPNESVEEITLFHFADNIYSVEFINTYLSGNYSVKIIANDSFNNINNSEAMQFIIDDTFNYLPFDYLLNSEAKSFAPDNKTVTLQQIIDLTLNATDLTFSNERPIEGEKVIINTTIHNLGGTNATSVLVQFLDDNIEIGNVTVSVSNFSTTIINNVSWTAEIGPNSITAKIDPINLVAESNETNNNASKEISVSAYFIFYGRATGSIGVGINSDFLFNVGSTVKNIFVSDKDSNINFNSLKSLGRNSSGLTAASDFTEADTLLNMSTFSDSVSAVFSSDGTNPKTVTAFDVFDYIIQNVAIINSTENTTFVTGILWDSSDDTNGEFDLLNQEDLTFITKINTSQVGKYGTYDYEIKIPTLLRRYKAAGTFVDLFLEVE